MSALCLRRRREDRRIEFARVLQPRLEHHSGDRAILLVVLPARSREVAADNPFDGQRRCLLAAHRAAAQQRAVFARHIVPSIDIGRDQMVGAHRCELAEPELGGRREHGSFARDAFLHHHVERRDAIRRDEQQVARQLKQFAHLATAEALAERKVDGEERRVHDADVPFVARAGHCGARLRMPIA